MRKGDHAVDLALRVLVLFLLFGGIIGVDTGLGTSILLFRDAFVVLPIYILLLTQEPVMPLIRSIPPAILLSIGALLAAVVLNLLVPVHSSVLMVIIGVRVWCFYIPFILVGVQLARQPDRLIALFRFFMICGLLVCVIGIVQAILIRILGYEFALSLFFGNNAAAVSQDFAGFAAAGGIYRVPATFSFVTQYSFFIYTALTIAAILSSADRRPLIRGLAVFAMFLVSIAAVFSGARATMFFLPLMLAGYGLTGILNIRFILSALLIIPLFLLIQSSVDFSVIDYFLYTIEVAKDYQGDNFFLGEITRALDLSPFGLGIGISTSAARHAADSMEYNNDHAFEPLLARAYAEMGLAGLMALGGLMGSIFVYSFVFIRRARRMGTMPFVGPIAVLLLMIVCQAFKGSMIDFDPLNVFFWLLLGVMFGLRMPDAARQRERRREGWDWLHTDGTAPR